MNSINRKLKLCSDRKNTFAFALLVLVTAITLRFGYVNSVIVDTPIRADASKYFQLAHNLVFNGIYSLAQSKPFSPTNYITPGYPLFLSALLNFSSKFENFYLLTLNIQALLSSLTALLTYYLALRAMPVWASFIVGLLVSLSPQLIIVSGYLLTETLFIFFLILAVFCCIQASINRKLSLFMYCGLLFGLSALIRPAILPFPLLIPLVLRKYLDTRQTILASVLIIIGTSLIWSSWSLWKLNNAAKGESNMAAAAISLGGYPNFIHKNPKLRGFPYREDPEYKAMSTDMVVAVKTILSRASSEPVKYLVWFLYGKPVTYWSPSIIAGTGGPFIYPVVFSIFHSSRVPQAILIGMMALHTYLVLLAALNCCFIVIKYFKSPHIDETSILIYFCVLFFLYFTLIHTILTPLPRYSFPGYPFAYLLAVNFVYSIFSYLQRKMA